MRTTIEKPPPAPAWPASLAARQRAARDEQTAREAEASSIEAHRLRVFEAKKDAFWGELIAACANATKAWNAADGSPVRVYASEQSPKSLTLRTERGTAGILLVLHESDAHLFVRQRSSLRGDTHYIAMVVTAGDELRARYDREDLAADSLARAVLEPWFTRLARERDA